MVCSTAPPRPCQKVSWRSFSLTRSASYTVSPISIGRSRVSEASTRGRLVKQLPMPVSPSLARISSSVFICSLGSVPPGQPVSWVAPRSGMVRTSVIVMTGAPSSGPRAEGCGT